MTAYTAEDAHAAVARGAEWLDSECPDWASKIDLHALALDNPTQCVLGQTAECLLGRPSHSYTAVLSGFDKGQAWAEEHGFEAPSACIPNVACEPDACRREHITRYEMLAVAWKSLISERLAAGVPK